MKLTDFRITANERHKQQKTAVHDQTAVLQPSRHANEILSIFAHIQATLFRYG